MMFLERERVHKELESADGESVALSPLFDMKAFFASLGVALALSAPALSVSVWGQCGVGFVYCIYFV